MSDAVAVSDTTANDIGTRGHLAREHGHTMCIDPGVDHSDRHARSGTQWPGPFRVQQRLRPGHERGALVRWCRAALARRQYLRDRWHRSRAAGRRRGCGELGSCCGLRRDQREASCREHAEQEGEHSGPHGVTTTQSSHLPDPIRAGL